MICLSGTFILKSYWNSTRVEVYSILHLFFIKIDRWKTDLFIPCSESNVSFHNCKEMTQSLSIFWSLFWLHKYKWSYQSLYINPTVAFYINYHLKIGVKDNILKFLQQISKCSDDVELCLANNSVSGMYDLWDRLCVFEELKFQKDFLTC